MTRIAENEEWAAKTGRSLAEVEAMIYEAENGLITSDMMDPSTLKVHIRSRETVERIRQIIIDAGHVPNEQRLEELLEGCED